MLIITFNEPYKGSVIAEFVIFEEFKDHFYEKTLLLVFRKNYYY